MRYRIEHKTEYKYAAEVTLSHHLAHLSPREEPYQKVERHELKIAPEPALRRDFMDYFGNPACHLTIEQDHALLSVVAVSVISVDRRNESVRLASVGWEEARNQTASPNNLAAAEFASYSYFTRPNQAIHEYGAKSFTPGRPLLEAVMELTSRIYEDFKYDGAVTDVSTPVDKVFEIRSGVCQDFAHLQLACLRALGVSARYVSGYLRTYPPKGQPRLIGADASHAWISVWCPTNGWIDFDPTNNKLVADEHITIAHGRDFMDVSPVSGVILGGGDHFVDVSVDVMPLEN